MTAEALCIVVFDCLRRKHEIADSEIRRERAGGPNADDRLHVVRVVDCIGFAPLFGGARPMIAQPIGSEGLLHLSERSRRYAQCLRASANAAVTPSPIYTLPTR